MSDANRVNLALIEESTYGVTPSGPPTLQNIRFSNESLGGANETIESDEIESDRQTSDINRVDVSAGGEINGRISYGNWDALIEACLQSADWSTVVTQTGTVYSMAAADNSLNRSSGSFISDGYVAKQWIRVSGFATAANNGLFKIVSVAATKLVLSHGGSVVNESAGPSVEIEMGAQVVNGVTFRSFSIEKAFTDLASTFEVYTGMVPGTCKIGVTTKQMLSMGFGFVGARAAEATATVGDGSNTAAPTTKVMNAVDNVLAVLEGGSSQGVTGLNIDINNNLGARSQVGTLGAVGIRSGNFQVSGGLTAYLASNALIAKFLNFTDASLAFKLQDAAGNQYVIDLPSIKYSDGKRVAGGKNQDVIADMKFIAKKDATEGITLRIARFAA